MDIGVVLARCERELLQSMQFWLQHSHDHVHGGFHNCLTRKGEVYDTMKYGWLQCRQVWMYCKLYNSLPQYHTPQVLEAAVKGGEFARKHIKIPGETRCYFAVTEDGRPARLQRKPYTECFYVMAMSELCRSTGDVSYQEEARSMLEQVIKWVREDDSGLGIPRLPGSGGDGAPLPAARELGRPMMLLNVLSEFCGGEGELRSSYAQHFDWCVKAILQHCHGEWVHEFVGADGERVPGSQGRLTNPGHAMEAGWFLLQEAAIRGDEELKRKAIEHFIVGAHAMGRDREQGGVFYFLDSEGFSPTQLEWSMKLWWVHCEGMVAFLAAYQHTREERLLSTFKELFDYSMSKFPDDEHGEWFGYLTGEGRVNQTFKGGPYKGCFHVPRCMLMCLNMLTKMNE